MNMETIKPPKVVIVKRSKWARGDGNAYLRNPTNGEKCCLGFLTTEAGFSTRQINDKREPDELTKCIAGLTKPTPYGIVRTKTCSNLMVINDDLNIDDDTREKKIITMGKRIGVNFKFKD